MALMYRAEWCADEEYDEWEVEDFSTLRKAQDYARRKSSKTYLHTYAVEYDLLPCADGSENLPVVKDLRQWVYSNGGLSYKETQ
jgi:hypothetical protein